MTDHQSPKSPPLRLDPSLPVSLVLGGGGVRGLAHVGVLDVLTQQGFQIAEIVGTSVGALIAAYYAAVGFDVPTLRTFGLDLSSRHLLVWGLLRRLPRRVRERFGKFAGSIPANLDRLAAASRRPVMHFGVERIGLVTYDARAREELLYHNLQTDLSLEDAVRGSVAIPGVFPPYRCRTGNRPRWLLDGGVTNPFPLNRVFEPPFVPRQVVAVDVSSRRRARARNIRAADALQRKHPGIPIVMVEPDTFGHGTILYGSVGIERLIEAGRAAALETLVREKPEIEYAGHF